eukprot:2744424-Pleurochrysis_carterae.AAC.1
MRSSLGNTSHITATEARSSTLGRFFAHVSRGSVLLDSTAAPLIFPRVGGAAVRGARGCVSTTLPLGL